MEIDDKIRDEKLQMTLTGKQQNYQHYHQAKLINMNILLVRNIVFWSKTNNRTSQVYIFSICKSFWKPNKND